MADYPTPKSYNQILGTMINAFQAKYPVGSMRVGGALLTILEAAASADYRASMDTLTLMASSSLASASGSALDRLAADENTQRISAIAASGYITVTDPNVTKVSSAILVSGLSTVPPVGATQFNLATDAGFTPTGSIYIGRGTGQLEGPLPYTSIVPDPINGGFLITLTTPTAKSHSASELVVLAQGGDRVINAGIQLQTPAGAVESVVFNVTNSATIYDGESSTSGVNVACTKPGTIGNVGINSLSFVTPPFTGAIATNPLPFSNGSQAEDDDALRDRIRNIRQTRSLGTALAITTALEGVVAPDEAKTIRSSSVVSNIDGTTVYIDDGLGCEQKDMEVGVEILAEYAVGGEQYFQLSNRPISRPRVAGVYGGPFTLVDGDTLTVNVGIDPLNDTITTHTFSALNFGSISNALPWEVVNSINGDLTLDWSARIVEGNKIVLYPRSMDAVYIKIEASTAALGFSTLQGTRFYDLWLMKGPNLGALSDVGRGNYLIDRNMGQVKLLTPLVAGEALIAGEYSVFPRTGYFYTAGLIGEANKILYGVPTDTSTYPGVIAAGARVDISPPSLKRIFISMEVRLRTGAPQTQVFEAVRSALASYINASKVGESIPISKLISLANAVGGVMSVAVTYPAYSSGNDMISVQAHEKPSIQDPVADIGLVAAGA